MRYNLVAGVVAEFQFVIVDLVRPLPAAVVMVAVFVSSAVHVLAAAVVAALGLGLAVAAAVAIVCFFAVAAVVFAVAAALLPTSVMPLFVHVFVDVLSPTSLSAIYQGRLLNSVLASACPVITTTTTKRFTK